MKSGGRSAERRSYGRRDERVAVKGRQLSTFGLGISITEPNLIIEFLFGFSQTGEDTIY